MKEELDFWDVGRKHMRTSWWKGGGFRWFVKAMQSYINCFHSSDFCHATLHKMFPTIISQSEPHGSHWHCYPEGLSILMTDTSAPKGPL